MESILKYFTNLTENQKCQFSKLDALYKDWNNKINVISRKDIENLYEHHILHSLTVSKVLKFTPGTEVMDIGTGGGFPGIPLAILFPESRFILVDSIGKKIKVATAVAQSIGLKNISLYQNRIENMTNKVDFVVSRAVMPLEDIIKLTSKNIRTKNQHNALPNGWICLKGGELDREMEKYKSIASVFEVSDFFEEEYFQTKKVVYLPYTGK